MDDADTIVSPDIEQGSEGNVPHLYITRRAFVMVILVSMGGMIFGYDIGQISGFLAMTDFKQHFGEYDPAKSLYTVCNVRAGLLVGTVSIGSLFGALIAAPLANKSGRKPSIPSWCIIFATGLIIQISSTDEWYQILFGRLIGGFGIGALSVLIPLYQSESSPTHIRGTTVCLYQFFITLGMLVANVVNYGTEKINSSVSWRTTMGLGFLWASILGLGILFFPESPRYVYRQGRVDEARQTMACLLGVPDNHAKITKELLEMRDKLDAECTAIHGSWWAILAGPRMLYRIMLGIALMSFQQLTGANFFFYYGNVVFRGTSPSNSFVTQTILGTVNVVCTFPGLYLVERFGRRPCLVLGASWMCVCFLVFASVGHFALDMQEPINTPKAGIAMFVFACLFIAAFASTWGPMVWGATADLYPTPYRATCIAIATACNWTWNFLIAFFTPFITSAIDYRYGYVFAACCAAAAVTVYLFLLESRGRTMEELDTMYLLHVKPWKSSEWKLAMQHDKIVEEKTIPVNTTLFPVIQASAGCSHLEMVENLQCV